MTETLRLGTRGSELALAQAATTARQLQQLSGRPVSLVPISTRGDESGSPIEELGTTGVFVTAVREALLAGEVDLVIHSCKDLPAAPVPGISLVAFPPREDPRDALIWPGGTRLADLPTGARVGTGSPRRAAQLLAFRPDAEMVPIRGNVGTRLRKLEEGGVDALLLAMAGLSRLGRFDVCPTPLDPQLMMPAPTQGVLAVECRSDDTLTADIAAALDHAPTRAVAIAERGFLAALNAGCTQPIGALGRLIDGPEQTVRLSGVVAAMDGSSVVRAQVTGAAAEGEVLGHRLAQVLVESGGAELLNRLPAVAIPVRPVPRGEK